MNYFNRNGWRLCGNQFCSQAFKPKRPHQRFCCSDCRRESWAANHQNSAQTPGERVRRPSRDGKGTRVYLTPTEIDFLQNSRVAIRSKADWEAQLSLGRKLAKATRRLG